METTRTRYNKVVNFDKEAMQKDSVIENILDCEIPMKFYSNKVQECYTQDDEFNIDDNLRENAAKKCFKAMKDNKEIEDFTFDCSYRELWDDIRKELGLSKDEAQIFHCTGGGRCFDEDFQGNINPELSEVIRIAEKRNQNENINSNQTKNKTPALKKK